MKKIKVRTKTKQKSKKIKREFKALKLKTRGLKFTRDEIYQEYFNG